MDDDKQLIHSQSEIDTTLAKMYFNQQNYVPDNITKVFPNNVKITLEDIERLNRNIIEKIKIHNQHGLIISVDIQYDNRQIFHFGTWNEFIKFDISSQGVAITNIVLNWKINVEFKGVEAPQLHTLTVKLSNGMRPEEMMNIIFSGNLDDVSELENNFFPVVAQCVYTDRRFGNELINLVSEWAETIKVDSWLNHSAIKFIKKHKVKLAKFVEFITLLMVLLGTSTAFIGILNTYLPIEVSTLSKGAFIYIVRNFLGLMILWYLAAHAGRWFGKTLYRLIDDYGGNYIFAITNYDKQRQDKMQKQKKYDVIKICGTIILNIVVNVFFILLDRWI